MRFRVVLFFFSAVFGLGGLGIFLGSAQGDDTATARVRFQEGVALYDKGEFDKARTAFLQAWALKKHPAILLNLAQSNLKSNRPGEAARDFVLLLKDPQGLTPAQKTEAEVGLTTARAKTGRIDVQTASGAEIFVDGERIGVAPMEAIDVDPGAHTVKVKDQPEQKVNVAVGQIVPVKLGNPSAVVAPASTGDGGAPPPTNSTAPDESFLGGHGESCRSRADCKSNLKCIRKTCIDENAPPPPPPPEGNGSGDGQTASSNEWLAFELKGVHPFVGLEWSGGPAFAFASASGITVNDRNVQGTFLFALRGGVMIGHHELALEVSPFTYMPYSTGWPTPGAALFRGAAFQFMGTYGFLAPLHEGTTVSIYWPIRVGVGMFAGGDNTRSLAYFQVRADVVGIALRIGHVMIDLTLPSFRYGVTDRLGLTSHVTGWHIGGSVSYIF